MTCFTSNFFIPNPSLLAPSISRSLHKGSLLLFPFILLLLRAKSQSYHFSLVLLINSGTLQATITHLSENGNSTVYMLVAVNGAGAFLLNVMSFIANKKTSPLAMNIGAIAKQVPRSSGFPFSFLLPSL